MFRVVIPDPGSGSLLFTHPGSRIQDPGSRGQKGTGSRIRIRNTGKKGQEYNTVIFKNTVPSRGCVTLGMRE
jgi:hypothetical protein